MKHFELTKKVFSLLSINNQELADQFNSANVTEEIDTAGYYVYFTFNEDSIEPLKNTNFPNIIGKDRNGKVLVGFVLFKKDNLIDYFEGYTFGDTKWPENDEEIVLEITK